jgi:hypothetical protein
MHPGAEATPIKKKAGSAEQALEKRSLQNRGQRKITSPG